MVPETLIKGLATRGTKASAVAKKATIATNIILLIEFILFKNFAQHPSRTMIQTVLRAPQKLI